MGTPSDITHKRSISKNSMDAGASNVARSRKKIKEKKQNKGNATPTAPGAADFELNPDYLQEQNNIMDQILDLP